MANVKITELANLTDPSTTDVMPVVDVDADVTKKVSVGEVVGKITGDVDVATDGTATISELPVSKLQDGDARQLLQTDAAGTGVEWTDDVDLPGTLDVTGVATLDDALNVAGLAILDGGIDVDGVFTVADATGNVSTSGTLDVGGDLDISTGLLKVTPGSSAIGFFFTTPATQPSAIADIATTATSGALPTADGSITIADAATPTATELLEYCVELESKLETALAALRTLGLIAT